LTIDTYPAFSLRRETTPACCLLVWDEVSCFGDTLFLDGNGDEEAGFQGGENGGEAVLGGPVVWVKVAEDRNIGRASDGQRFDNTRFNAQFVHDKTPSVFSRLPRFRDVRFNESPKESCQMLGHLGCLQCICSYRNASVC
jgi:hypothetical protein